MTKNFDERIIAEGFHTGYEVDYVTIQKSDYERLIEQAERVQELKVHKDIYYKTLEKIGDPKNGWNPLAIEARIAIEKVGNLEGEE